MKYIKHYEDLKITPQIGDYVISASNPKEETVDIKTFLLNNIGQIVSIINNGARIRLKYENVPSNLLNEDDTWWIDVEDILHHSSNKEELEIKLTANKYNL